MQCSWLVSITRLQEYKSTTKHCNADGLSRLPLLQKEREETEVVSSEVFHATQFEPLPVTSEAVARETRRDLTVSPNKGVRVHRERMVYSCRWRQALLRAAQ